MTLQEIHEVELGLIARVDDFCGEHGLRYYLAYGTLLGAIRHDGFIPWDDDADLWLPRKDYDYFISHFEEDEKYKLIAPFDRDYGFRWAKLLDKRTAYQHEKYEMPDDYGLTLDLFPLDEDRGEKTYLNMRKLSRLGRIKWRKQRPESGVTAKTILRDIVSKLIPEALVDERGFLWLLGRGTPNGRLLNCCSRYTYRQESTDARDFGVGVRKAFEKDCAFMVPDNAEGIIEQIYGPNWREPVVSSHPTKVYWRDSAVRS